MIRGPKEEMVNGHYTVRSVARILKVQEETVRRYIRENKLRATRIKLVGVKKVWGIKPSDLDEFQARVAD